MAFYKTNNVLIKGISACVPVNKEDNKDLTLFADQHEASKFIEATGVEFRHIVRDSGICTSDLCFNAAHRLMDDLNWNAEDIDCLIFVSQTPDYILPATSCILQERLKLSQNCYAMDISLGCSGWVYGLSVISSLISSGFMKKGLLLAGDTTSVTKSAEDKSTYPLFGDAGTATAVEYAPESDPMIFNFGTDGKGYEAIIIPDGGFRSFFSEKSFVTEEIEPGIKRNRLQSILNGPAVFTFAITKAPKSVNALLEYFNIEKESIDYFIFHQANFFMNEKIRTKLKIDKEKTPYCLREFGNTSSASIPLTLVDLGANSLKNKKLLACAFGVGLSWASVVFESGQIHVSSLIEI
ncbi:MAG TPA: ketoacyl-ACP synthase III [Candidatus Cloacimonadota bacterium]|nr:ketoacyl-ACP synthase III [Candidatus Cloacimonadota bacterium]